MGQDLMFRKAVQIWQNGLSFIRCSGQMVVCVHHHTMVTTVEDNLSPLPSVEQTVPGTHWNAKEVKSLLEKRSVASKKYLPSDKQTDAGRTSAQDRWEKISIMDEKASKDIEILKTQTHIQIHIQTYTFTHTYIHPCTQIHITIQKHTHLTFVHLHRHVHTSYTYADIHMYTYTCHNEKNQCWLAVCSEDCSSSLFRIDCR